MGGDQTPSGARNGGRRHRNLDIRCANDSRQSSHWGFGSVGCGARAFDRLVDDQVMPQVERLEREACGKQTQHRYLGESWNHGASTGLLRH